MPLFLYLFVFRYNRYIFTSFIHHSFINIRWGPSISSQLSAQWVEPPWGAEPRFELGPALQQASALPTEPHCTHTEPHCTLSEPHCTLTEPHCTLTEPHCTLTEPHCTLSEPHCTLSEPHCTIFSSYYMYCKLNYLKSIKQFTVNILAVCN